MKKILFTFVFVLLLATQATAQLSIGYMNPQEALTKLPKYAEINQELETLANQRQQEQADDYNAILAKYQEYAGDDESQMTEEQRSEIDQLLAANQAKGQQISNELRNRQAQLLQPIIDDMNAAIEAISTELGLDIILNSQTTLGDPIIYYTAEDQKNITQLVVDRMLEQ